MILYSVVASTRDQSVPADSLYIAGLIPGLLMIAMVAAYARAHGASSSASRARPSPGKEVLAATWEAKWELAIPIGVVVSSCSRTASPRWWRPPPPRSSSR